MWLLQLEANYVLAYVACETRSTWFLHGVTLLALAVVVAAGFAGWRAAIDDPLTPDHASSPVDEETALQRVRWMAAAAVVISAGFALLIIATDIPVIVHRACD
jgi:hypothetical protein